MSSMLFSRRHVLALLGAVMLPLSAYAVAPVGAGFVKMAKPQPSSTSQIQIEEFFWYGCGHCNALDSKLTEWAARQEKDVSLVRVAPAMGQAWKPLSMMFYTLNAMGVRERLHASIFKAIHVDHTNLNVEATLLDFLGKNGVDTKLYQETAQSFSVATAQQQATQLAQTYNIEGVPTLVVAGQYVTSVSMAGGELEMFKVLDKLVSQVRTSRVASTTKTTKK